MKIIHHIKIIHNIKYTNHKNTCKILITKLKTNKSKINSSRIIIKTLMDIILIINKINRIRTKICPIMKRMLEFNSQIIIFLRKIKWR